MLHRILKYSLLLSVLFCALTGVAQDKAACIYGTVITVSGQEYEGYIRWGKEEMYWHDIFNSSKMEAPKIPHSNSCNDVPPNQIISNFNWDFYSIWDDKYDTSYRSFTCYFGDIASIVKEHDCKVNLVFKNDFVFKLKGGSNDVCNYIVIQDYELGKIKLDWSKISRIDFKSARLSDDFPYSNAIYGQVKTRRKGKFTGFIKWDMEERQGDDLLDGDSADGRKKIPFKNIAQIEKTEYGSFVTMNSGRTLNLKGTNDVNSQNKGIEIFVPGTGSMKITWKEFVALDLTISPVNGPSYTDFESPKALQVELETYDEDIHSGNILFDMDEMWGAEMLDGKDDLIEYWIPFSYIQRIAPKNENYAMIHLYSGESLLLGNTHDTSDDNDGILFINTDEREATLIDWNDIFEIRLK